MSRSIKTLLAQHGVLAHVILPPDLDMLLAALETTGDPDHEGGILTGSVRLKQDLSQSPLPGLDFALTVPTGVVDPAPYKLKLDPFPAPTSFHFWLVLADQEQLFFAFQLVDTLPGLALTGAEPQVAADGAVTLAPLPANDPRRKPKLVSRSPEGGAALGPALLIAGTASAPAQMRFTPDTDSTKGIISLGLEPATVLFGDSQIGFDCPTIVIDDSDEAAAPGQGAPALDPPLAEIGADQPAWRGLLARQLDFYLPAAVPFVGGRPIKGYFALPLGSGSPELVLATNVPPRAAAPGQPAQPGFSLRIECLDPDARGLSGLAPTLIAARMDLPLDGAQAEVPGTGPITFAAGKPVRLTVTLARDLARDGAHDAGAFKVTTALTAQGQNGLLSVTSREGDGFGAPKAFNLAAAMATALIADQDLERSAQVGDGSGVILAALAAAGGTLSALFEPDSQFVLHGAELESTGHGLPVGEKLVLTLDYSVAARVIKIEIPAALSVAMRKDQPMRIRVRRVRMSVDPAKAGLAMIGLDFDRAEMELENPGAWDVGGLKALFDVVGSRSGRGSSWIEVDLRFKLNLGPISVSDVTLRATLNNGRPEVTLRGLEAGLDLPGVVSGTGRIHLIKGGFEASLAAAVTPLNTTADAGITYAPPMVVLSLGVDLPAPIPLANSGFGLFGIGGLLGFAAVPDYGADPETDPVLKQLQWSSKKPQPFRHQGGQATFGFDAAVGTLPDLGFSFSSKAGLLITVPDVAVRGALNGRVLMPPVKMTDPGYPLPPPPRLSFLGFIGVDKQALSFGVLGDVTIDPLLKIQVPLAGYFPLEKAELDNWYLYLGADGAPLQGRQIGPISARVLPDILGDKMGADAYLMLRGRGLEGWPHGRTLPNAPVKVDGFVVAFGFALQNVFGVPPIAWAELYASLDLLLATKPPTLAGFGRAGGSLHLGPFSLGVEAQVNYLARRAEQLEQYFWAEVAGRIELLFFDVEGKVTIAYGTEPVLTLPDPDRHPLDRLDEEGRRMGSLGVLTDDSYRVLARLVDDPAQITDADCVWPDAIISLPFAFPPKLEAGAGAQFPAIKATAPPPVKLGSEMLAYQWHLTGVTLVDVTDEADRLTGPGVRPNGQLAARWQAPRGSTGDDVSELLLLSTSGDLWVNRLADGGAGLPTNPLQQTADICRRQVGPEIGWAIGLHAAQRRTGFYLPPGRVSPHPLASRVGATLHHFGLTRELTSMPLDGVHILPHPFSLDPAQRVAWPQPEGVADHEFTGHLRAPTLRWLDGRDIGELNEGAFAFAGQQVRLTLDEPIEEGRLVLVVDEDLVGNGEPFTGLEVIDDRGNVWKDADKLEPEGGIPIFVFRTDSATPVRSVTIRYPVGRQVGIGGLGGITLAARNAADAENNAFAAESARRQAAAQAGPKLDPTTHVAYQRVILKPGRLYRLDIDMSWSGEIFRQNADGGREKVEGKSGETCYTPRGTNSRVTTNRRLFFKTAPVPQPAIQVMTSGMASYSQWVYRRQDLFEPEMLERYLAGYEPAQSDLFRFCDDPLRAHFRQDHVAALAKAYGFEISVAVRRTDHPGEEHARPTLLTPAWQFASNPAFLDPVDQLRYRYALASPCVGPLPGATAAAVHPLEPESWYEVYVLAKPENELWIERGRLPGVTFRTSRWRSPVEMLAGLGFAVLGGPAPDSVLAGDLVIGAPAAMGTAVVEGDDQAFANGLAALGLEGWPVTESPRLSRLWVAHPAGGWRFAGLMIESPEPIQRADRVALTGLALTMGAAGPPLNCTIRRSDRSRSRLVYLLADPVPLAPGENGDSARLFFTLQSTLDKVTTSITGALSIPAAPAFAEDPV